MSWLTVIAQKHKNCIKINLAYTISFPNKQLTLSKKSWHFKCSTMHCADADKSGSK